MEGWVAFSLLSEDFGRFLTKGLLDGFHFKIIPPAAPCTLDKDRELRRLLQPSKGRGRWLGSRWRREERDLETFSGQRKSRLCWTKSRRV